jgi:hypothetical protein
MRRFGGFRTGIGGVAFGTCRQPDYAARPLAGILWKVADSMPRNPDPEEVYARQYANISGG